MGRGARGGHTGGACRRLGLALALLLAATASSGCISADLGTAESVPGVEQPNWSKLPVYWESFGGPFGQPDYESERKVAIALGGGRVYVASEGTDRVAMFDAKNFTPLGTFGGPDSGVGQLSNPVGIAYYRDEVFVADPGNTRIAVYDATGNYKRQLLGDYSGIDVAWGEVWAVAGDTLALGELWDSFVQSPRNSKDGPSECFGDIDGEPSGRTHGGGSKLGGALFVLDAQTGLPKSAMWHAPHAVEDEPGIGTHTDWALFGNCPGLTMWVSYDDPGSWWDIATEPAVSAAIGGHRLIDRTPLLTGVAADNLLGSCDCDEEAEYQDGTDAVWGMRWLLTVSASSSGAGGDYSGRGKTINEYSIEPGENGAKSLVRRRRWSPHASGTGGSVRDIAYQNREVQINWRGKLAKHDDWMNAQQSVEYVVSDADILPAGNTVGRWLEQARNFSHLELRVSGRNYPFSVDGAPAATTSTDSAGMLTLDLDQVPSGTHRLELIAHLTNGQKVTAVNDNLLVDHDVPTGRLDPLGYAVRGTVTLNGSLADAHKGPKDWRPQLTRSGQGAWGELCGVAAPGPYTCVWDTTRHADGWHDLRARLNDLMVDRHDNPTHTTPTATIVDNNAPTFGLSGSLVDAGAFPLEYGEPESLNISAGDGAGSGIASIEVLVDGVQRQNQTFGCTTGGCSRGTGFTFWPEQYGEGLHTVEVVVRDHVGFESRQSFQRDVEMPPPAVAAGASAAPAARPGALAQNIAPEDATELVTGTTDELLRCTGVQQPLNFVAYSLGSSFEGLPITGLVRDCELPYPREPGRANHVTYIYGDCDLAAVPTDGGCAPPLEVQTWPACERNLTSYFDPVFPDEYDRTVIRDVPAAVFEDGTRVEVYAGGSTIVVFGLDPAQVRRAAESVVAEPSGQPPTVPASNPTLDETTRSLPEPLPGATQGALSCLAQVEEMTP